MVHTILKLYHKVFENPNGPDPAAPNDSQAYITETASRAVIFIKADNPKIGLIVLCCCRYGRSIW